MSVKEWYDLKAKNPISRSLQIGCNEGENWILDCSSNSLKNYNFSHQNAENMYFQDIKFDKITAIGSLECCDIYKVFLRVFEYLKSDGLFEFTIQRDTWWIRWYRNCFRLPNDKDKYFTTKLYTLKKIIDNLPLTIVKKRLESKRTIWHIWAKKKIVFNFDNYPPGMTEIEYRYVGELPAYACKKCHRWLWFPCKNCKTEEDCFCKGYYKNEK